MKKLLALAFSCLVGLAHASPTAIADPVAPGPSQPTACSFDASGRPIPCLLLPVANGFVQAHANLYSLAVGTYTLTMTYTNSASSPCTGGPAAFTCDGGGGPATSNPITLTITNNAVTSITPANVRVTFP